MITPDSACFFFDWKTRTCARTRILNTSESAKVLDTMVENGQITPDSMIMVKDLIAEDPLAARPVRRGRVVITECSATDEKANPLRSQTLCTGYWQRGSVPPALGEDEYLTSPQKIEHQLIRPLVLAARG